MANIEKRGKNSWRLNIDAGFDAEGRRLWHRKTVRIDDADILKSKKKIEAYLQGEFVAFRQQIESGQIVKPDRTTFEDFIGVWKANYADQKLGEYTRRHYLQMINAHLLPAFGHLEMRKIQTMHIVAFMTKLRDPEERKTKPSKKSSEDQTTKKALAANSQLNIYKALKSIMDAATKWKVIEKNPMEGAEKPAPDKAEKKALRTKKRSYTPKEADQLVVALGSETTPWRLYFLGLLIGGFRRGELLAVEWPQVDFERGGLHIEKQISLDENGRPIEAQLKTESSEGFVPMPKWYMRELSEFRKEWIREKWKLGNQWLGGDREYIFHGEFGKMMYATNPTMHWRRFLDKHPELPRIRLHDLRHTAAMLLREDGVDLKTIQERLRHSELATTANLYTHESEKISRDAADRLERFDPKKIARK